MLTLRILPPIGAALIALSLFATTLRAQVPQILNYQGRVAVGAVNFDGAGQFRFALVDSTSATTFWSNDGTSVAGSEPTVAVSLAVSKGLYSVLLGDLALINMTAIPASVFTHPDVRLRVWFDDGVNGSQLLAPDQRIAAVGYAMVAADVADGAITAAKIAPGSITGDRLAPATLDFSHLIVPVAPGAGQVLGFNGASLNWTAPGGGSSVFSLNGTSAYYNAGYVGMGTSTPAHRLSLAGGPFWTANHWVGAMELANLGAIAWKTNISGLRFGMGHTNGGFGMFRTASDPGTDASPAIYDLFIDDVGNVGFGGNISYNSMLSKLDVDSTFTATVRAADFIFGHPSRRGSPGRAMVDLATTLAINYGDDWARTLIGGAVTEVKTLRATGDVIANGAGNQQAYMGGDGDGDVEFGSKNASVTLAAFYNQASGKFLNTLMRDATVRALTIYGGADLAEPFAMSHADVAPGTVVVIDAENPGKLRRSAAAYDKKVAGIVSGANGIRPGISMIQEDALEAGENVALSGRVYVKANTSAGPIAPGDLLTTSDIPGEAMKAADQARAQGAILGKAMTGLLQGDGTVLVLVTLQ